MAQSVSIASVALGYSFVAHAMGMDNLEKVTLEAQHLFSKTLIFFDNHFLVC